MLYKLIVIANINHDFARLRAITPIMNAADYVIFCGDGANDIMSIRKEILVPLVCVKGNNDMTSKFADMVSVLLGDTRVMVTHGYKQIQGNNIGGLISVAMLKGCQMVLFGHSHKFCDIVSNGIQLICPGALYEGSYAAVVGDGITFKCKQEFI